MTALSDQSVVPEFAHAVRGYDRYQVDDYVNRLNEWAAGAQARALEAEKTCEEQAQEIRVLRDQLADIEQRTPAPDHALRAATERAADAVAGALKQADEIRRRAGEDADQRLEEASRQASALVEATRQSVVSFGEDAARERREARQRVDTMLQEARARAEDVIGRATASAEKIEADAASEAARIVSEAESAAADILARTEDERRQADEAVHRLQAERKEILAELNRLRSAIHTLISGAQSLSAVDSTPAADGAEPTVVLDVTAAPTDGAGQPPEASGPDA